LRKENKSSRDFMGHWTMSDCDSIRNIGDYGPGMEGCLPKAATVVVRGPSKLFHDPEKDTLEFHVVRENVRSS